MFVVIAVGGVIPEIRPLVYVSSFRLMSSTARRGETPTTNSAGCSMPGRKSRSKGIRVELEVVNLMKETFPGAARNWAEQMEKHSTRDILGTPGFFFQVKGGQRPNWGAALCEAQMGVVEERADEIAVGITRADRKEPVVHLILEDFLLLVELALSERVRLGLQPPPWA